MTPVNSTQLQFGDPQVYIWSSANAQLDLVSDGAIVVGAATNINLTATDDVILPANVGILFGSGEKIEGDNTDLTVTSGADIVLSATTNVNIPQNKGLSFATYDAEKISSDGTDLTVNSGGDINLTAASGDINIPNDIGVMYGIGGEKIESDGTDLTITSTGSLILTASGVSGSAIKDEDNMSSDSDTHLASQQSIKAYVDAQGSATETLTNKTLTSPKLNENVAVTTTATELNLIDGATARGTDAIADGDGVLINDGGTMKMTKVETLAAYLDDEITAMPALVTTAATTVGTISSGTWEGTAIAQAYIAADAIDGTKVADDAIDSDHYTDGSIDFAHIQN
ncbi:MAG: hypothetical protein VX199_02380, partial [Chloroflexota bacterium]|nr:hypothetical protein [Chloroflexota bacterium]